MADGNSVSLLNTSVHASAVVGLAMSHMVGERASRTPVLIRAGMYFRVTTFVWHNMSRGEIFDRFVSWGANALSAGDVAGGVQ